MVGGVACVELKLIKQGSAAYLITSVPLNCFKLVIHALNYQLTQQFDVAGVQGYGR